MQAKGQDGASKGARRCKQRGGCAVARGADAWSSRRLRSAALRALAGLWLAVLVYYVCDLALGVNDELSVGEILSWSVITVVTAPVMATLGWPARGSVLAALTAPALMVVDTWWAPSGPDRIRPWAQVWVYVGAAVLAVVLVPNRRRSRP